MQHCTTYMNKYGGQRQATESNGIDQIMETSKTADNVKMHFIDAKTQRT